MSTNSETKIKEGTFVITPSKNVIAKALNEFFGEVAQLTLFTLSFFKTALKPPYEFKEIIRQCYLIGFKSFVLVIITGFIIGLVLTIQSRPTLAKFGAES